MKKRIAIVGTLDTKGREYAFLKQAIEDQGLETLVIDAGVMGEPQLKPDIGRDRTAEAGGGSIEALRRKGDRGEAVTVMGRGVSVLLPELYSSGMIHGVIALGGGGGTSIACTGMRALPLGVPKVMVSTAAGGDVSGFVGIKDIVMVPSIVDVSGINRISRGVFQRAAAAVCAMVEAYVDDKSDRPLIAATMFGNTTPAVETARHMLEKSGFEVVVFPCSGTSGRVMEELIASGYITGVLDMTTTEWADQLVGGVLAAGEERMDAAAERGIPQVVVPGCLDMVNFWEPASVPERFNGRTFYQHNPNITLMRTSVDENRELGRILAVKLNRSTGSVAVFIPLRGLSMIDAPGGAFWMPEADRALFDELKENLIEGIPVTELDCNINEPEFALACAQALLEMLRNRHGIEG
ncbi:MAG: Tm-1-like ATP-binding domain-containing protein [Spirochaetes bacterium]|nr:Tm-1-like ATP-binding domain-containing protein [Spirochaetota bacterium]